MSNPISRLRALRLAARLLASWSCLSIATLSTTAFSISTVRAAEIVFDLPESIECRDVTPPGFSGGEYLKVIEGKLRISARVVEGAETEIVDFIYVINSPDKRLRFQDYLPNTTLESAVAGDQIEVKDATETANTASADVHVVYKILSLGGTLSQSTKDSEANCYRQIAPKELVVASGTTDREHGVFFRLRPSRAASLEGAKEFSFLATVPKDWRGDVCTISCSARVKKDSFWSDSVVPSGNRMEEIGLYLAGDVEAASLAEELRRVHESYLQFLAIRPPKPSVFGTISSQTVSVFGKKKPSDEHVQKLAEAEQALTDVRQRLKQLGR
jgi:hypothetical protein